MVSWNPVLQKLTSACCSTTSQTRKNSRVFFCAQRYQQSIAKFNVVYIKGLFRFSCPLISKVQVFQKTPWDFQGNWLQLCYRLTPACASWLCRRCSVLFWFIWLLLPVSRCIEDQEQSKIPILFVNLEEDWKLWKKGMTDFSVRPQI